MAPRCLVVDDDDWTRDYVRELLARLGIESESASDGLEAAAMLDEHPYEVVFLDLDLPEYPGEAVLQGLVTSRKRPTSIVVMSGAPERLARISPADWRRLGITAALPKPLDAADLRIAVERLRKSEAGTDALDPLSLAAPGSVLLAGGGLWLDALSCVARRGGGNILLGRSRDEALTMIASHRPDAIIAGPPISETELLEFCGAAARSAPSSVVIAAVSRADAKLRRALSDVGAAKVCVVPSGAGDLAVAMINAARLTTREHARVRITTSATVVTRDQRMRVATRDVSEGGLCLEGLPERLSRGGVRVEFGLPGEGRTVVAESELAWSSSGNADGVRAGLRFAHMSSTDRVRIRGFVEHHAPRATFADG